MKKIVTVTKLERGQYIRLSNRDNKPFLGLVTYVAQHDKMFPQSAAVLFQPRVIHSRRNSPKITGFLPLSITDGAAQDLYGSDWDIEVVPQEELNLRRKNKLP
jgi:hypothetical protein